MLALSGWYYGSILVLLVLLLVAMPLLAARKGYAWYLWILTGGVIGAFALALLPYANKPDTPPEVNSRRRRTGNIIGSILSGLTLLVLFFYAIVILMVMLIGSSN